MIYDLKDYDLYIVDLDGTLYNLHAVKIMTVLKSLLKPHLLREYLIVQKYRKLYKLGYSEKEKFELLPEGAPEIIKKHMLLGPGELIYRFRSRDLIRSLKKKMEKGKTVVVYSDYPVNEKLSAIGFNPTKAFSSDSLGTMKPNPEGIKKALKECGLFSDNCLVIGDRQDKDGQLAERLGADALIRSKFE